MCRVGIDKVCGPSFCLASLFPTRETPGILNATPIKSGVKIVIRSLVVSRTAKSNLKAIASAGACDLGGMKNQPSRVDVATALIWRALIKGAKASHGHLRPSLLTHAVDMRATTTLPIPASSFGKLFMHAMARLAPNESKMGLPHLVSGERCNKKCYY